VRRSRRRGNHGCDGLEGKTGSKTLTFTNGVTTAPGTNRFSYDPGPVVNLAIGYKLPANFRAEVEAGYASYLRSKVNPLSAGFPQLNGSDFNRTSGGRFDNYSATINVFYDIPINDDVAPFVGIGMGAVHRELSQGRPRGFQLPVATGRMMPPGCAILRSSGRIRPKPCPIKSWRNPTAQSVLFFACIISRARALPKTQARPASQCRSRSYPRHAKLR
jgi:hypothetical protein